MSMTYDQITQKANQHYEAWSNKPAPTADIEEIERCAVINGFLYGYTQCLVELQPQPVKLKFKDAPIGARFKQPNSDQVWVKINSYPAGLRSDGLGLIAQWNGNVEGYQSFCCFVDEEAGVSFDTEIELI